MKNKNTTVDINEAFKSAEKFVAELRKVSTPELIELNLSVLFSQLAIELYKCGHTKDYLKKRLDIEYSIYADKQKGKFHDIR